MAIFESAAYNTRALVTVAVMESEIYRWYNISYLFF